MATIRPQVLISRGLQPATRLVINGWLNRINHTELCELLQSAPQGIAADWIEDHRGQREWIHCVFASMSYPRGHHLRGKPVCDLVPRD